MMTTSNTPIWSPLRAAPAVFALGLALTTPSTGGVVPSIPVWTATATQVKVSQFSSQGSAWPHGQTNSRPLIQAEAGKTPELSPAQQVSVIRAMSGLTTDQVGRLFGVSRRSIHNWMNGHAMAARHAEQAQRIFATLAALPASTPGERRATLLASSSGESLFQQLLKQRNEAALLQVEGVPARARIGL